MTERDDQAAPALSVIIAVHDAVKVIRGCLIALKQQLLHEKIEIIVADSSSDGSDRIVRNEFPEVQLLHFSEPLTIPELRGRAIALSRGEIVAVIDAYSIVAADWAGAIVAAHASNPRAVIGGSVDLARRDSANLRTWAQYFNEYGLFMPPIRSGSATIVPGSNVSYRRDVLFDGERARFPVFWKTFVNWQATSHANPMWLDPAIRVELHKPIPFSDFLLTRFSHARCFAGMRVAASPVKTRIGRALSAPLVPWILLWRWSRGIWAKGRHRPLYLATLPHQVLLFLMWGLGEFWGYAFGTGRSCRNLYY